MAGRPIYGRLDTAESRFLVRYALASPPGIPLTAFQGRLRLWDIHMRYSMVTDSAGSRLLSAATRLENRLGFPHASYKTIYTFRGRNEFEERSVRSGH